MTKETNKCPMCGKIGENVNIKHGKDYVIYRCSSCHGDFTQTVRQVDYRTDMYNKSGDSVRDSYKLETVRSPEEHLSAPIRGYMVKLASNFLQKLPFKGKLLDVGCGVGTFARMAEKVGFEAHAFDPSEEAIKYARENFGLKKTFSGTIADMPNDWRNFDVVSALEVIEHVDSPRDLVGEIYSLLNPGGYIIVSVPNRKRLGVKFWGIDEWDLPPNHLTRWDKQLLIFFLKDLGFTNIRIRLDSFDRRSLSTFLPPKLNRKIAGDESNRTSSQDQKENNSFGSNLLWKCIQKMGDGSAFILRNVAGDICNQYLANAVIAVAQKPK